MMTNILFLVLILIYFIMNKKFFTLLMAVSLLFSSGAMAQLMTGPINFTGNGVNATLGTPAQVTSTDNGFVKGKSYYLGNEAGTAFLQVASRTNHELVFDAMGTGLTGSRLALWTLQDLTAPEGATPKYYFVNEYAGVSLAMDLDKAVAYAATEGFTYKLDADAENSVTEWLNSPAYKVPTLEPVYYTLPNDSVAALMLDGTNVYLAKMTKAQMNTGALKVRPYKEGSGSTTITLSPRELNTMLVENMTPTSSSYFRLQFDNNPTMNGGDNLFETDLQAVAVRQFEVAYGKKESEASSIIVPSGTNNMYTSLYPLSENWIAGDPGTAKMEDWKKKTDISFTTGTPQWVALKNRDGKYLVVDTEIISGTEQLENPRLTFKFVDLYNAKKDSRFRDPRSYLFKFDYNPVTKSLEISSLAFVNKAQTTGWATDFDAQAFYAGNYQDQPIQKGDKWYSTSSTVEVYNTDPALNKTFIVKAALMGVTEVTVGAYTPTANPTNKFVIKLGSSLNAASFSRGAYLIKVIDSEDKTRIGKYYVKNLKGGFEMVEEAKRQEFQNMPAAQWVLTSTRTTAGSPVKFVNREFPFVTYTEVAQAVLEGILYRVEGGESNEAFFINSKDKLSFTKVSKANDAYLGYKYVAGDTIGLSTFKFEYLHELQMDRPLTVTDTEIPVVKVATADGGGTYFSLEKVLDDDYGYDGTISSLANLKRAVYRVYVNEAFKVQEEKEYLTYNSTLKKYVTEKYTTDEEKEKASLFFLKENNYDGGKSYYALVRANTRKMITPKVSGGVYTETSSAATMVTDEDLDGKFLSVKGEYKNPLTGVTETDKDIIFGYTDQSDADDYLANSGYEKIARVQEYTDSKGAQKYGILFDKELRDVNGSIWDMDAYYASLKVSVDVNSLELVNGVLSNSSGNEVATSAFAVTKNADPLYRTLGAVEGETTDENLVKFFRVNGSAKEYLYEDANSDYSTPVNGADDATRLSQINFLGIEGKGDTKKPTMWAKYIPNDKKTMPQYVIAVGIEKTPAVEGIPCPDHGWDCEHAVQGTPEVIEGRFLINFSDSISANDKPHSTKFQWNAQYTRLGFVPAKLMGKTMIIDNSVYTGNKKPITVGKPETFASKDTIDLSGNKHNSVVFQFRLPKTGSNDFLIESESWKDNKPFAGDIAPSNGGWVKIQNGVPVIANTTYSEAGMDAEIFNLEIAAEGENATSNEGIEAGKVSVVAGQGYVTIKGAAGQQVVVANILGQVIANKVLTLDEETVAAPAGVVVVSVGGTATKALVK